MQLRRLFLIFPQTLRRMARYIYQQVKWPEFYWDEARLATLLATVRFKQGKLLGSMEGLGFSLKAEASLQSLTQEILKSSEIEGELLDANQVRSSIARRLGIEVAGLVPSDRDVEGVVEMMLDATQKFREELSTERLFGWHSSLFPSGRSGMYKIVVGGWRTNTKEDPMQVVSGAMGRERIHFQAPDSNVLEDEMANFIRWFNNTSNLDPVIKAGIAHLRFVTLHPFDDGNGRMARAITDMQLARADETPDRFYSMSAQIRMERNKYYDILEQTQRGSLDITEWLVWFLECLERSITATGETLSSVLKKGKLFESASAKGLNERQRYMLNRLHDNFEGKLTSSKWAKMTKCSQDTASRDIQNLIERGILVREDAGGRSTSYKLAEQQ